MVTVPLIHVIILNWNHLDDLKIVIDSFLKQDYSEMKIIVADNGSTDGSIDYVKNNYKEIELLQNGTNLGYAAGNNRAIENSLSEKADYILLANNDIYFEETGLISSLVKSFEEIKNQKIGFLAPIEYNYPEIDKKVSEGWVLFDEFPNKVFNRFRKESSLKLSEKYEIVDFVSGCFVLINPLVFKDAGFFDEKFFMYFEEAELAYRAWQKGYASVVDKRFRIFHKGASTSGNNSSFTLYYRSRNILLFIKKHRKYISAFYIAIFYYFFIKVLLKTIAKTAINHPGKKMTIAKLKGYFDGFRNN
jgi:GT2 family glycosyltransferase